MSICILVKLTVLIVLTGNGLDSVKRGPGESGESDATVDEQNPHANSQPRKPVGSYALGYGKW